MSFIIRGSSFGIYSSAPITNASISNPTISNPTMAGETKFTGNVVGVTKAMVGLSNVDNTNDLDKPISNATQLVLDSMTTSYNPEFTGLITCEDIIVNNTAKINTYLHTFIKNDETEYTLGNENPNVTICGSNSDIVNLPTNPLDGLCINISNMSENDLFIRSTKTMYNLFLARDGINEVSLQKNFMYTFIYTENLQGLGNWNFKF
jgi:hypothetical protein